jgi:hypothetical protein
VCSRNSKEECNGIHRRKTHPQIPTAAFAVVIALNQTDVVGDVPGEIARTIDFDFVGQLSAKSIRSQIVRER